MKVLLKEDVEKLGAAGEIVTVADGYARNYLIPQGLGVKATAGQVKQISVIRRQAAQKRERIASRIAALAESMTGVILDFSANASERGRLYGSVTQDEIAQALSDKLGVSIDRRKIETSPLRDLGLHRIPIRLSAEVIPTVQVIVHREGEDPAAYLPQPEEPAAEDQVEEMLDEYDTPVEAEAEAEETEG